MTMLTLLLRISILYYLLRAALSFLPKKLRSLPSIPWIHASPHGNPPAAAGAQTSPLPRAPGVDQSELDRVFRMFDRNGDGRITKEELRDSLENLGIFLSDSDLASTIEKVDADGDGCVDAGEFMALYQGVMEARGGREQEEEDMREAFEVFDVNGDGFITVDELRSVLSSLGLRQGLTAEECRMMIGRVDGDGDGRVSFKEFRKMMKGERWSF